MVGKLGNNSSRLARTSCCAPARAVVSDWLAILYAGVFCVFCCADLSLRRVFTTTGDIHDTRVGNAGRLRGRRLHVAGRVCLTRPPLCESPFGGDWGTAFTSDPP